MTSRLSAKILNVPEFTAPLPKRDSLWSPMLKTLIKIIQILITILCPQEAQYNEDQKSRHLPAFY